MDRSNDESLEERIMDLEKGLERLESRTGFLRKLSLDERCALPKLDEDRERFTREALNMARQRPELLPPHSNLGELEEGLELRNKLRGVFERSNKMTERLDDTIVSCGAEAYITALAFFRTLSVEAERDPELEKDLKYLNRLFQPWEEVGR